MRQSRQIVKAFSLVEMIVVLIVIGILAFTAVPRFSRGSASVADSALAGSLAVLRNAIDLYSSDHNGALPTYENFAAQLTQFTDVAGNTSPTKTDTHYYGPYLRKVPLLTVGPKDHRGRNTIVDAGTGAVGSSPGAWYYNPTTGDIRANLPAQLVDYSGTPYCKY